MKPADEKLLRNTLTALACFLILGACNQSAVSRVETFAGKPISCWEQPPKLDILDMSGNLHHIAPSNNSERVLMPPCSVWTSSQLWAFWIHRDFNGYMDGFLLRTANAEDRSPNQTPEVEK